MYRTSFRQTYIAATDMIARLSWLNGQKAADHDLVIQKGYVRRIKDQKCLGLYWIEAEEMDGTWTHGQDYKGYSGTSFRVANNAAEEVNTPSGASPPDCTHRQMVRGRRWMRETLRPWWARGPSERHYHRSAIAPSAIAAHTPGQWESNSTSEFVAAPGVWRWLHIRRRGGTGSGVLLPC